VDHDRTYAASAVEDGEVELGRQVEVDLHGRQCLLSTLRVFDLQVDLGSVERCLPRDLLIGHAEGA